MIIPEDVKVRYADDTAEWEEGEFRYVVKVHQDYDTTINDFECYGKTSKYAYDYWRDGRTPRPDGFTGRARKIEVDRGMWVWWEPYNVDGEWDRATEEERRKEIRQVTDLLQSGFVGITLEQMTRCDQGHWHNYNEAGLWGIDSLENDYDRDVIAQLLEELQ